MAIDFDIALYRDKIERAKNDIAAKSFELVTCDDPFVIATLRRSLDTLEELLSIYEQTERTLTVMAEYNAASRKARKEHRPVNAAAGRLRP